MPRARDPWFGIPCPGHGTHSFRLPSDADPSAVAVAVTTTAVATVAGCAAQRPWRALTLFPKVQPFDPSQFADQVIRPLSAPP